MKKDYRIAPEIKREILDKIKDKGLTVKDAETQYGISEKTVYGWLSKGAEGATDVDPGQQAQERKPAA